MVPTEAEARRGLDPFSLSNEVSTSRALALGATALLGALIAGLSVWRARQPRDLPSRVLRRAGLR